MADENQKNPMIAYFEARISAWQAALASFKSALALDGGEAGGVGVDLAVTPTSQNDSGQPVDLPEGAFFGKSVPECAKLFLSAAKRKKTTKEITAALRDGGVESTSAYFENNVTTALNRLKAAGQVLKFKDGWGLSEWYPAHLRAVSPTKSTKPAKRKIKGSKRGHVPAIVKAHQAARAAARAKGKRQNRVLDLLLKNRGAEVSAEEIATEVGMDIGIAKAQLGRLVKSGSIEKTANGEYTVPALQLNAAPGKGAR